MERENDRNDILRKGGYNTQNELKEIKGAKGYS